MQAPLNCWGFSQLGQKLNESSTSCSSCSTSTTVCRGMKAVPGSTFDPLHRKQTPLCCAWPLMTAPHPKYPGIEGMLHRRHFFVSLICPPPVGVRLLSFLGTT